MLKQLFATEHLIGQISYKQKADIYNVSPKAMTLRRRYALPLREATRLNYNQFMDMYIYLHFEDIIDIVKWTGEDLKLHT